LRQRADLQIALLGPLDVRAGGAPVAVPRGRQAVVLASLAMSAGQPVGVDTLAHHVWGERLPEHVRSSLHTLVARLRQALAADVIVSAFPGYRLDVDAGNVDVLRFRRLTAEAAENPGEARGLLTQALALWRGDALAGLQSEAFEREEAPQLAEERLVALQRRIELDLAAGQHDQLLPELQALTECHPLRERLWALRMLALYRSGRTAEAIGCFSSVRATLIDELGIEPGPELSHLQGAILKNDPLLDLSGQSRHAAGVFPMPAGDRPYPSEQFPAAAFGEQSGRSARHIPHQLPQAIADFSAREAERAVLRNLMTASDQHRLGPRIALIAGQAGVGKTTLAVHLAHEVAAEFPDGQLFADLRGAGEKPAAPANVLGMFLRAFGVNGTAVPGSLEERAALYRTVLAGRRVLVVLDNAADEAQIGALLPGSASCGVLVTSRTRLAGIPGTQPLQLGVFADDTAIAFLGHAIGAGRIEAEPGHALELVRKCGGLPLALRIAAARLVAKPHWRIEHLSHRLRAAERPLSEWNHGELDVRSTLTFSYKNLSAPAQTMLRRIGLLDVSDFPVWAAAALLDIECRQAEDLLEQLVDAQLLDVQEPATPGRARYHCHDLIRAYARELAAAEEPPEDQAAALRNAFGAWLAFAEQAHSEFYGGNFTMLHGAAARWRPADQPRGYAGQESPLDRLAAERSALCAAIARSAELGMTELSWDLAWTSVTFFGEHGYFDEWRDSCEQALAATRRAGDQRGTAAMLRALADRLSQLRSYAEARSLATEAVSLFTGIDDPYGRALAQHTLAIIDARTGSPAAALTGFGQAARTFCAVGDRYMQAAGHRAMTQAYIELGDYAAAERCIEQAQAIFATLDSTHGQAQALHMAGELRLRQHRYCDAEQIFGEFLALAAANNERYGEALALLGLGEALAAQHVTGRAMNTLERAHRIARCVGDLFLEARALLHLGILQIAQNQADLATRNLTRSAVIFEKYDAAQWHRQAMDALEAMTAR
jgi:DNA-binding SARP family transcriptional activator